MSNPPNRLAQFRTYSYHHILIVTDGMNTANELSASSNLLLFNKPNVQPEYRYKPRFIDNTRKNGYVTLIDGMSDVTFFVESVKWETIIAPSGTSGGSKRASTLEVDGEMTIIEPLGVKFLEVLTNAGNELGTDPSGLIFVLKTVFVGHTDSGGQDIISDVRPFIFTMIDVKAIMDAGGTTYNLSLVGVNNGTAKLPQISRIADGINLHIKNGTLIPDALAQFFEEVNKRYDTFKTNLNNQLQSAKSTVNVTDDFRLLEYQVVVDDAYADYVAADNEVITTSSEPGSTIIACAANSTIENSIMRIMDSSLTVMNDASKKNPENKRFIYKIVSTILPDFVGDKMIIQYSIHRYEEITQTAQSSLEPIAGEFIEFDYMFTGRNVDVLEFDIKMDMGMSFFQTVATAKNGAANQGGTEQNKDAVSASVLPGTTASPVPEGKVVPPDENNNPSFAAAQPLTSTAKTQKPPQATATKIKTPLFLGTTIKDPVIRNKRNPLESATFDALLARHAAYENVECAMKIAGNPQLLDESTPLPTEVQGPGIKATPTEPNQRSNTGLQSMFTTPALIKVNVKFPSDNELTGVDDFWYNGFYNLYSITQNFDGGLFTQDIQMFSLPVEDADDTEEKLAAVEKETQPETAQTETPVAAEPDALEAIPETRVFNGNPNVAGDLVGFFDEDGGVN